MTEFFSLDNHKNIPDIQERMFQNLLAEISPHLKCGPGRITEKKLNDKLVELFKESKKSMHVCIFEGRVQKTFELFKDWLESQIGEYGARLFLRPIKRQLNDRKMTSRKPDLPPDDFPPKGPKAA
jgi:hypothetical protein